MIDFHDFPAVEQWIRRHRVDPGVLKPLRGDFYKRALPPRQIAEQLPPPLREAFLAETRMDYLRQVERLDSQIDGASKFVFQTDAGRHVEAVLLRIRGGRTTVCVSSQVGCAVGCPFCATGRSGLAAQLSTGEILDQAVQLQRVAAAEGRKLSNLVFMGMGEPLHNRRAVFDAIDVLIGPQGFYLPPRRVVVSTVGIPEAMLELARRFPRVRLAVSLHAARREVRERLVPEARRCSVEQLRRAVAEAAALQQQPVMLEYLMLRGINDGPEDSEALIAFARGIEVHVNLIPFNAVDSGGGEWIGSDKEERHRFGAVLKKAGLKVTVRHSLGGDIQAACGQLAQATKQYNAED